MSQLEEITKLSDLVRAIKTDVGRLLSSNITVAIVNPDAEIQYIDKEIEKFSDFIISFTKGNFELLSIGDHSLPLSGTNIAFFKVSDQALVILNSDKGPVGQLLAFKGRMQKFTFKIDELLASIPAADEEKAPSKAAVRVPVLTVPIKSKKFGMEEAKVMHLVNGENTIADICEKTKLPQLKVDEILRKYQKKKWIKLKRVIIGVPEAPTVKPTPAAKPTPPSIREVAAAPAAPPPGTEAVYVFPILEADFTSTKFPREDADILRFCNGQYTVSDIVRETSLNKIKVMEVIKKYEKKGKIKLTKILPSAVAPAAAPAPRPPIEPAAPPQPPSTYAVPAMPPSPIPEPQSEEEIFSDLVDFMDQTQPIEMQTPEPPAQPAVPAYPQIPSSPPPSPSPAPPNSAIPQESAQPAEVEMSEIKGEPVTDALFDDLASLLDQTSPMDTAAPPAPAGVPAAAPPTPTSASPPTTGSSLLEGPEEGIKITTYPEQADPLQDRLDRLSNILDETTEVPPSTGVKSEVKIVGSKAVCPHCNTHVIMMAKVCPNCQRALRTCPNCKSPITLFARICPSCGSLL